MWEISTKQLLVSHLTSKDGITLGKGTGSALLPTILVGHRTPACFSFRDGTLLCASYGWAFLNEEWPGETFPTPLSKPLPVSVFFGRLPARSIDGEAMGRTHFIRHHYRSGSNIVNPMGIPIPPTNRRSHVRGKNGRIIGWFPPMTG